MKQGKRAKLYWGMAFVGSLLGVLSSNPLETEASNMLGGPSHLGTFEGSTTFTTSSSNGINPGLYLEVMDEYGNYHEYTSEEGVITVPHTQEGAYVTQAKLLGKTKYRDQDTGELLDQWEAGRNLTLESVQMPVLCTTGKNLFDSSTEIVTGQGISSANGLPYNASTHSHTGFLRAKPNTSYTITQSHDRTWVFAYDKNKEYIKVVKTDVTSGGSFVTPNDTSYIRLDVNTSNVLEIVNGVQIEEGSTATSYEPYKSNILTVNEAVELRGVGDVKDELDLLNGELTQKNDKIILDGSSKITMLYGAAIGENTLAFRIVDFPSNPKWLGGKGIMSDKFKQCSYADSVNSSLFKDEESISMDTKNTDKTNAIVIRIHKEKLSTLDIQGFKIWLSQNPIIAQYQLESESIKTVGLNSTYHFKPVKTRAVYVDGTVVPLVCSVTVPTQPLSFVLNPNEEPGKQFIAPEFTIENNNPASLSVSLKEFKQVTTVFNDVLPSQHVDWSQLDQDQSKDLALALVPKVSDGWKQLKEGPRYVVDSTNDEIGEIKPKSSVDFTFSASHGPAFTQALSPRYRLVFVFDF